MSKIHILDEHMVNMIAAGEVIERPASVVKELLENSIDAGARRITVTIADGGRKLISVSDDGAGMNAEDLSRAFEPHATSKVKTSKDLSTIQTMGFRGEALASIASVAQVRAVSRPTDSVAAHCIEIDSGRRGELRPCSGAPGTTIEIRNLFYKVPARRKFLRTANTETTHIIEQFTRVALAHQRLDMVLIHNNRELYRLTGGTGQQKRPDVLSERVGKLFSRQLTDDLLEVSSEEKGLRVFGLVGRPGSARATSKFQYVFLNGRCIRDRFVSHAINQAYQGLVEPGRYPVAFLFLEMPWEAYDVNVHPAKLEVRFENPNLVHSQVLAVLREKLLATDLDVRGRIPADRETMGPRPVDRPADEARRREITEAMADFFKQHTPIQGQQQLGFGAARAGGALHGGGYVHPGGQGATKSRQLEAPAQSEATQTPMWQSRAQYFQLHNSYIVAQSEEGFVVIDQHALHERIIYEQLCRRIAESELQSQRLAFPESFELTEAQADALKSNSELIARLGIEIEPFGPKTVAVQAFPALLGGVSPVEFMRELLDLLMEKAGALDEERLVHEVLDMMSCKAAIKAGRKLSDSEIEDLLSQRQVLQRASRCPHGRPTTIKFTLAELEKQFKRT